MEENLSFFCFYPAHYKPSESRTARSDNQQSTLSGRGGKLTLSYVLRCATKLSSSSSWCEFMLRKAKWQVLKSHSWISRLACGNDWFTGSVEQPEMFVSRLIFWSFRAYCREGCDDQGNNQCWTIVPVSQDSLSLTDMLSYCCVFLFYTQNVSSQRTV